jgi:hypothetical protein
MQARADGDVADARRWRGSGGELTEDGIAQVAVPGWPLLRHLADDVEDEADEEDGTVAGDVGA